MRKCDKCGNRIVVVFDTDGRSRIVPLAEQEIAYLQKRVGEAKLELDQAWTQCEKLQAEVRRLEHGSDR